MKNTPIDIFGQYSEGTNHKSSLGTKGLFEQSRINERFFIGDQWHGAKCGNDRPLVRHNVIKRIGNYKMAQLLASKPQISFSAEGIPTVQIDDTDSTINDKFDLIFIEKSCEHSVSSSVQIVNSNYFITWT